MAAALLAFPPATCAGARWAVPARARAAPVRMAQPIDWAEVGEWPEGSVLREVQYKAKAERAALEAAVAAEDYGEASRRKAALDALRRDDPVWSLRKAVRGAVDQEDFAEAQRCQAALRRLREERPCLLWRDTLLVLRGSRELWVYAEGCGEGRRLYRAASGVISQPTWSPDGDMIGLAEVGNGASRVIVLNAEDGSEVASAATPAVFYVSWTPDSAQLTFLHTQPKPVPGGPPLVLGSLSVSKKKATYVQPGGPLFYALGKGGALLAHNGFLNEVTFATAALNGDGGQRRKLLSSKPSRFRAPVLDPECAFAAYVDELAVVGAEVSSGNRFDMLDLRDGNTAALQLLLAPDGKQMLVHRTIRAQNNSNEISQELLLLNAGTARDLFTGKGDKTVLPCDRQVVGAWFSPDSKKLLCLELAVGEEDQNLPTASGMLATAVWTLQSKADNNLDDTSEHVNAPTRQLCSVFEPALAYLQSYLPFIDQFVQDLTPWSPDSSSFCFACADGRVLVHQLQDESPPDIKELLGSNSGEDDGLAQVVWWSKN